MSRLYFKYYVDVTLYNGIFCLVIFLTVYSPLESVIVFGTIGTPFSFLVYRYLHKIEYYFYGNAGLSRKTLQLRTFFINLAVTIVLAPVLWIIHSN